MGIQNIYDTAANLTVENPTLAAGEWGFESDTGAGKVGDGTTLWNSLLYSIGKWQSYTPTWTGLTISTSTVEAEYLQQGPLVTVSIKVTLGGSWAWTGGPGIASLPITAEVGYPNPAHWSAVALDNGVEYFDMMLSPGTTANTPGMSGIRADTTWAQRDTPDATTPFTWATGDSFWLGGSYKIAFP